MLAAARYKRYIVPIMSLSIDFYIRVFLRIYTSGEPLVEGRLLHCADVHAFPLPSVILYASLKGHSCWRAAACNVTRSHQVCTPSAEFHLFTGFCCS